MSCMFLMRTVYIFSQVISVTGPLPVVFQQFPNALIGLQQRTWLIHWSLFVFFNHAKGRDLIIDMFLYQNLWVLSPFCRKLYLGLHSLNALCEWVSVNALTHRLFWPYGWGGLSEPDSKQLTVSTAVLLKWPEHWFQSGCSSCSVWSEVKEKARGRNGL